MAATNAEILAVLDAIVRYLSIDLPCQSLTPDAQMGREDLLHKVENLLNKIDTSASPAAASHGDKGLKNEIVDDDKRMSSYMDMTQFQYKSVEEGPNQFIQGQEDVNSTIEEDSKSIASQQNINDSEVQADDVEQETTYKIPELDKNSENSGDFADNIICEDSDMNEFTDDELMCKLKTLENTSPKQILEGSLCSGYMLKQKKKMISKWNRRFCIVKDWFLFYYKSEKDSKALGLIVLPGYNIQNDEASSRSNKFIFKLFPTSRGRSSYLFQLTSKSELDMWLTVLMPICCRKLNRLKSDVFNRVARQLDEKSEYDENHAEIGGRPTSVQEEGDIYEPIAEEGPLTSGQSDIYDDHLGGNMTQIVQPVAFVQEDTYEGIPGETYIPETQLSAQRTEQGGIYDDHIGGNMNQSMPAPVQEDMYEGIPGENFNTDSQSSGQEPIQEDIYEDIPGTQLSPVQPQNISMPPAPVVSPTSPAPFLPPRTPVLPFRPGSVRPGNEDVPLPPEIPIRKPVTDQPVELIEEEPKEEVAGAPLEEDFSFENVYIGTRNRQGSETDELTFSRGDIIYVLNKVDPHWWIGCLNEKVGLVPSELLVAGFAH